MNLKKYLPLIGLPVLLASFFVACGDDDDDGDELGGELILATTTSTNDSGLLDELVPVFENQTGTDVKIIAVGTGAALAMAGDGEADAVLVHAPASEQEYIDSGDLINGQLIMHNDFVLVGPEGDPAGAGAAAQLNEALDAIADNGSFISRGDDSGTHKKELALWEGAGIDPTTFDREETGQGMGATLNVANERQAYTLTDRATFLALRGDLDLVVVREGDASLLNIYHGYEVNGEQHGDVNEEQAQAFVDFLVSDEAQDLIEDFGVEEFGEPLFVPDAGKSVDELGG